VSEHRAGEPNVPIVTSITVTDQAGADRLCTARDDLVAERISEQIAGGVTQPHNPGPGHEFTLAHGPFQHWDRSVVTQPQPNGNVEVTETISFRLALPVWRFMFTPLVRRAVVRPADQRRSLWWLSPDRLDASTATALSRLCVLSMAAGYLGTLLTQTNTFAKAQFGSSDTALSTMLASVRLAAVLALVVVAIADRRGRRSVLLWSAVAACVLAATGAVVPDLAWLGISQTAARTASTAMAIVIGIYAIEEMPAGSRAFAVSVLAMTAALGAGMCVAVLPLADLGPGGWRLLYLFPLAFAPAIWRQASRLPETRRFQATGPAAATQSHTAPTPRRRNTAERSANRRRFVLLAASAMLLALFTTPASQLLNEYLRAERGYSALTITLFTLITNTPGVIGIIIGGRLADTRGRRLVGAVAIGGGVAFTVAMFLATGSWIWIWSVLGALVGAAAVPALGVYGPELFPTASRGSANGGINLAAVAGAVVGLLSAGLLSDAMGGLPPAMALLAIGPLVVVILIVVAYPETAQRELEDINPGDRPPPAAP
jgi:MFS family permease